MHYAPPPVRVLIVDDSLVIRGLIARHLKDVPGINIVASASDGARALEIVARGGVDVVILDIEMPVMDGLTALPKLLALDEKLTVIMASTLTSRNAAVSLRALRLGAADYVPKPSTSAEIYSAADFRRELIDKITLLGRRRHRMQLQGKVVSSATRGVTLRGVGSYTPRVLAIASSTGGPRALEEFLSALPTDIGIPVLVTQHMPPTFTALLAEHLTKATCWPVREAVTGDGLEPGCVLIAPGDHHLLIDNGRVRLDTGPRENFCRPAADPMLRSLVARYRGHVLSVVLTGMGQDGLVGSRAVIDAGGTVLAQDEASSTVWGMPGAVTQEGLSAHLGTPADLARAADKLIKTGALA